jgi:uncharacterized membrane protein
LPSPVSHRLFLLTLTGKGLLGLLQLATAVSLFFGVADRLPTLAQRLFASELRQDPSDFLASRLLALAAKVPGANLSFYQIYFAAHGLLHVGVVALLLLGHGAAYPTAIVVLAGFVVYQAVEWVHVGGPMLLILSAIDIAVIWLTLIEWRRRTP